MPGSNLPAELSMSTCAIILLDLLSAPVVRLMVAGMTSFDSASIFRLTLVPILISAASRSGTWNSARSVATLDSSSRTVSSFLMSAPGSRWRLVTTAVGNGQVSWPKATMVSAAATSALRLATRALALPSIAVAAETDARAVSSIARATSPRAVAMATCASASSNAWLVAPPCATSWVIRCRLTSASFCSALQTAMPPSVSATLLRANCRWASALVTAALASLSVALAVASLAISSGVSMRASNAPLVTLLPWSTAISVT